MFDLYYLFCICQKLLTNVPFSPWQLRVNPILLRSDMSLFSTIGSGERTMTEVLAATHAKTQKRGRYSQRGIRRRMINRPCETIICRDCDTMWMSWVPKQIFWDFVVGSVVYYLHVAHGLDNNDVGV